jgi:hypothetical protein
VVCFERGHCGILQVAVLVTGGSANTQKGVAAGATHPQQLCDVLAVCRIKASAGDGCQRRLGQQHRTRNAQPGQRSHQYYAVLCHGASRQLLYCYTP